MNRIRLAIICSVVAIFTLVMTVAGTGINETRILDNVVPEETLFVNVLHIEGPLNAPIMEPITIGEHGKSLSDDSIDKKIHFKAIKLKDNSNIKMDGKLIHKIENRLSSSNTVYYYYGADEKLSDSTKLLDFMKAGGVVITTSVMENPDGVYAALANFSGIKDKIITINGAIANVDAANDVSPTQVHMYPGNDRIVSVWANASVEDTIKIAEKLELQSEVIDLKKYVDPNWTDGPIGSVKEPQS